MCEKGYSYILLVTTINSGGEGLNPTKMFLKQLVDRLSLLANDLVEWHGLEADCEEMSTLYLIIDEIDRLAETMEET